MTLSQNVDELATRIATEINSVRDELAAAPGIPGPQGETGPAGIPGPKGDKGDAGNDGAPGATGPSPFTIVGEYNNGADYGYGAAVYYQGGTYVRTGNPLNPGYPPTPGAINASWTPIADKGEAGAPGNDGAAGPQGLTGSTGAAGAPGSAGAQGPKGDTGEAGATGPKGDKGDTGEDGIVTSPTPPTNTTVLWQDTSVPNQSFVPAERTINTTAPLLGGGSLDGNLTLSIDTASLGAAVRPFGIPNIVDTMPVSSNAVSIYANGYVNYITFAVGAPLTVSSISVPTYYQGFGGWNSNDPQPAPDYVAFGLYQITDNYSENTYTSSSATLLAKSANDTSLLYLQGSVNKAAFSSADGYPTSYTLQPNVRYAVGVMALNNGNTWASAYVFAFYSSANGVMNQTPYMSMSSSTAQTALPITDTNLVLPDFTNYAVHGLYARLS